MRLSRGYCSRSTWRMSWIRCSMLIGEFEEGCGGRNSEQVLAFRNMKLFDRFTQHMSSGDIS